MRFLVDECVGPKVARWLSSRGHEVFSTYDEARGRSDDWILKKAFKENWILITNDKDFGEKVYYRKYSHHGIILLRLNNESAVNKISTLKHLISRYSDQLAENYVVVSETQVRIRKNSSLL